MRRVTSHKCDRASVNRGSAGANHTPVDPLAALGTRTVLVGDQGGLQVSGPCRSAETFTSARSEIPKLVAESAYLMRIINPKSFAKFCIAVRQCTLCLQS